MERRLNESLAWTRANISRAYFRNCSRKKGIVETDTKTRPPPMAMKIIIGKFGEDGEPIWFEVESDDCKKGRKDDEDANGTTVV